MERPVHKGIKKACPHGILCEYYLYNAYNIDAHGLIFNKELDTIRLILIL
ncbi:MAG: hypothetical protein K0S27_1408 [Gammaproteobacteria bacterium]|jgi:hypothetical protein|nr:hypothetical protein [Gammaproteobacteria bacterium]